MPPNSPISVRLPFTFADPSAGGTVPKAVCAQVGSALGKRIAWAFMLSAPERRFVVSLFRRHRQLWVYRTHQTAACGDFVIIDMSAPKPEHRRAAVVELKSRGALKTGVVGQQLRRYREVITEIAARDGVIATSLEPRLIQAMPCDLGPAALVN